MSERICWACKQPLPEMVLAEPEQDKRFDEILIEQTDLPARAVNCLHKIGVYTVGQLASKTRGEVWRTRNMGKLTFAAIEKELARYGLKLKVRDRYDLLSHLQERR